MSNSTAIRIVATGILVILLVAWWLIRSITSEIIDVKNELDSLQKEMEWGHHVTADSFPFIYDSTSFTFDTNAVNQNSYILKSDDSVDVIFMNKDGEKIREDKIWLDPGNR